MVERTLIERLNVPWPEHGVEEVTLPAWILELCAEAANALTALEEQLAEAKAERDEYYARGFGLRSHVVRYLNRNVSKETLRDAFSDWESATDYERRILSALEATPAPKVTEADWRKIYDKLAEEGGGTWATYMMMEIAAAYGDHELAPEAALTASEAK